MKKLLIAAFLTVAFATRAEYTAWYVQFELITANDTIVGWVSLPAYEPESSPEMLRQMLAMTDNKPDDTLHFAQYLVPYRYAPELGTDTLTTYTLVSYKTALLLPQSQVKLLQAQPYSYLIGLMHLDQIADTTWAYQPAKQYVAIGGYFCDWQIFVHQPSKKTEQILAELSAASAEWQSLLNAAEAARQGGYDLPGSDKEALNRLSETIDDALQIILKKFAGQHVVIVSFCSC